MSTYFDQDQAAVWVQPDGANTEPRPLMCVGVGELAEALGDSTWHMQRNATGGYDAAFPSEGLPSGATVTLTSYLPGQQHWLQKLAKRGCYFPAHLHVGDGCGRDDAFLNYVYGETGLARIVARPRGAFNRQPVDEGAPPADPITMRFDLKFKPVMEEYWQVTETYHTAAEDESLRDIVFVNPLRCPGPCGAVEDLCTRGVAVANAAGGAAADVWLTVDGGVVWAAAATNPFGVDEDINSVHYVWVGRDTVRIIVQRGTPDAGVGAAEIAYSDDWGQNWTNVDTGAVANEYGMHSGGLWALDERHIWAVTDQGNVYFSSDGCVTWVDQGAPDPLAGAQPLYYVHFRDNYFGWACGDNNHIMRSGDGGQHWYIVAGPGAGTDVLSAVCTIDSNRVWVAGRNVGGTVATLYYSNDRGANWNVRALPIPAGYTCSDIGDVQFVDDMSGWLIGALNDGADDWIFLCRTFDGGFTWEIFIADTALDGSVVEFGGNALWPCGYNECYGVGEAVNSLASIIELQNLQPS